MGARWKFKPVAKGDKLVDPMQQEFFASDSVGGLAAGLVRETVQNSLDARAASRESDPTRVRFAFYRGEHALPLEPCRPWLVDLTPHVNAPESGLIDPPTLAGNVPVLLIEDFGTHGLRGDPSEYDVDPTDGREHNFFYFWRNVGRSGKGSRDRGRWGLGKAVFAASSRWHSVLGLTVRSDDRRALVMGQAVLKIHRDTQGNRYGAYGDFGLFGTGEEEFFALPVEDPVQAGRFRNAFQLKRSDESGLSLVVPFPDDELTVELLARAAIEQYFHPILGKSLVLELQDNGNYVRIDDRSIRQLVTSLWSSEPLERDAMLRLLEMAAWCQSVPQQDHIALVRPQDLNRVPRWGDELLQGVDCEALQRRFDASERLAFRIPVKVHRKHQPPAVGWFAAYLERDEHLKRADNRFLRAGITIAGMRSFSDIGVRGLLVVDEEPLTTMLGDAENPAHTEWQKDSPNFKGRYEHGATCISFVKAAMKELLRRLLRPARGEDRDLLRDVFFLPHEGVPGGRVMPPNPPQNPTPPALRISSLAGGVRIAAGGAAPIGRLFQARLAYMTRRGNPFKRYSDLDFRIEHGSVRMDARGATIEHDGKNGLKFRVDADDFQVTVVGFDQKRDVVVDLQEEEA